VYTHLSHAFLHKIAYEKLVIAAKKLEQVKPKWKLIVFDALRPRSAQRKLYQVVQGTPEAKYVMDPEKGSFHNYGFAIDIGLLDEMGKEVDMGTGFDDFTVLAEPKKESENLKAGTLTTLQLAHRKILRDCMEGAGFTELPIEWWHFDAISRAELKNYPIVE
jgi:D-alanyl-D-alanine dipeptidase